jgi:hypothetical protein
MHLSTPKPIVLIAKKSFSSIHVYRKHLKDVHKMILEPLNRKKILDITPDLDDPDYFCRACEKGFFSYMSYRAHLKTVHKMKLKPLVKQNRATSKRHRKTPPLPDDSDVYCQTCDRKYSNKSIFRTHLKLIHKMKLDPLRRSHTCHGCKRMYLSDFSFGEHLKRCHVLNLPKRGRPKGGRPRNSSPEPSPVVSEVMSRFMPIPTETFKK